MILRKLLGKIFMEQGLISDEQLEDALKQQRKIYNTYSIPEKLRRVNIVSEARRAAKYHTEPMLGKIFMDMGLITNKQLKNALDIQRKMVEEYKGLDSNKLGTAIEIGSIVNSTLNLAEVLTAIMRHANQVTNSVASTLMLLDEEKKELVFSVPTGPKADQLTDIRIPCGEGIAGWVAEHEDPVLVPDVSKDPRFYKAIDKISGFETKSILCVPIKSKTKLIGVLEVVNKTDGSSFTRQDSILLSIFAQQAAMAIENARLYKELRERMGEILVNIAERKQAEEDLRRVHGELEKKIAERTSDLTRINDALKEEIEERKKTERALQKSEDKYRALVENLKDVFFNTDKNGVITYVNAAIESLVGKIPSKILGKHFMELVYPDDKTIAAESIRMTLFGQNENREYRIVTKTGTARWVLSSIQPIFLEKKVVGLCGMLTDITKSKLMQEHLIQSERLAATGRLAASIAHELESPLESITQMINTIQFDRKDDRAMSEKLNSVQEGFERIKTTLKNLLDLNNHVIKEKAPTQINRIIESTVSLFLTPLQQNGIRITLELSKKTPVISASPPQLQQVFMHLIRNSLEVFSGAHETQREKPDADFRKKEITIRTNYSKGFITVKVSDTGPGIAPGDIDHVFDPFFTTKKNMEIGLGLSIAYRIIENHRGTIQVSNIPDGGGTLFTLRFPAEEQ
jgi:PAS domain S-box-containing protein